MTLKSRCFDLPFCPPLIPRCYSHSEYLNPKGTIPQASVVRPGHGNEKPKPAKADATATGSKKEGDGDSDDEDEYLKGNQAEFEG